MMAFTTPSERESQGLARDLDLLTLSMLLFLFHFAFFDDGFYLSNHVLLLGYFCKQEASNAQSLV